MNIRKLLLTVTLMMITLPTLAREYDIPDYNDERQFIRDTRKAGQANKAINDRQIKRQKGTRKGKNVKVKTKDEN